jgi:hypothetical protein
MKIKNFIIHSEDSLPLNVKITILEYEKLKLKRPKTNIDICAVKISNLMHIKSNHDICKMWKKFGQMK